VNVHEYGELKITGGKDFGVTVRGPALLADM